MNNTFINFKDKLFAKAKEKGFSDWEIYIQDGNSFSVKIFKGEIDEYKNTGNTGVSFRGTFNGKMGYAYSEKIGDDVIEFLLDNAKGNASVIEDPDKEELYPGDSSYEKAETYSPSLDSVPVNDKISKAIEMDTIGRELDMRVAGIDYCAVSTGKSSRFIANSMGLDVSSKNNHAYAVIEARVGENDQFKSDYEIWAGYDWNEFDPEITAKKAVNGALSMLGAKPVPTGVYDIILEKRDASNFLGAFCDIFNAENVQKGFSLLKGKIGECIGASCVTIRDDALLPLKSGSRSFDDEGVAAQNKAVVENGVLKTFLHNTKTAKKDGVASTGNGVKYSYKSSMYIAPSNFYIVPSKDTEDDLIKEMKNGLVIKDLAGLHSGIDIVSGDFSLLCGGYLAENGVKTRPIEQITIAGNFFTLLKNIVKTANEIDLVSSNIASPSLWIKDVKVSGD